MRQLREEDDAASSSSSDIGHRITRGEGALMLAGYAGYTAWLAGQV